MNKSRNQQVVDNTSEKYVQKFVMRGKTEYYCSNIEKDT